MDSLEDHLKEIDTNVKESSNGLGFVSANLKTSLELRKLQRNSQKWPD